MLKEVIQLSGSSDRTLGKRNSLLSIPKLLYYVLAIGGRGSNYTTLGLV
jgi:hypothetical protein